MLFKPMLGPQNAQFASSVKTNPDLPPTHTLWSAHSNIPATHLDRKPEENVQNM